MKADLYNLKNETVGSVTLSEGLFGATWKPILVKQAVVAQLANKRRPWAHVKDRSEVRGGGRKPWRQKGTGRARHGSIRSPIWSGGGKAHGPTKDRDYSQQLPKQMRRAALISVLSKKFADNEIRFVQDFSLDTPKTKLLFAALKPMLGLGARAKKVDTLIIRNPADATITRTARNIPKAKVVAPNALNVYDALSYKHIFVDANALPVLEQLYLATIK